MTVKQKNKKPELVSVQRLRDRIKEVLESELEQLPATLEKLEPKERLFATLKLLPLIIPRPEPVHYSEGEPFELNSW